MLPPHPHNESCPASNQGWGVNIYKNTSSFSAPSINELRIEMHSSMKAPQRPDTQNIGETFHSEIIKNLAKEGYDIRRLKSSDFSGFRIFYIVDEDCSLIYILEIIPRNNDTYKSNSPHYTTVKRLYVDYFTNKEQRSVLEQLKYKRFRHILLLMITII